MTKRIGLFLLIMVVFAAGYYSYNSLFQDKSLGSTEEQVVVQDGESLFQEGDVKRIIKEEGDVKGIAKKEIEPGLVLDNGVKVNLLIEEGWAGNEKLLSLNENRNYDYLDDESTKTYAIFDVHSSEDISFAKQDLFKVQVKIQVQENLDLIERKYKYIRFFERTSETGPWDRAKIDYKEIKGNSIYFCPDFNKTYMVQYSEVGA